ncbi:thiamine phosphate synthase [Castellaniella sp.]|uniref:thiamine phosphate synthase n=1 Tax=Castellaniella sp. TaxID=1955812 RepID=UPI003560FE1E
MNPTRLPRGLYGITPDWPDTDRLLEAIEQAHAGGMVALQWRRKQGAWAQWRSQARAVRDTCARLALPLIINDHWQLALEFDADGVHLGRDDADIGPVRAALGARRIIGCSCYDQLALAARRLAEGADYIAFGALYPSSVKPDAVRATLDHIHQGSLLVQSMARPRPAVVAIGGLNAGNAAPVIQAGADGIAVISALFDAPDIEAAARRFQPLFS